MGDKKKVGVRVDESLWNRFREYVQDRRGRVRGVLGEELEKALEQRMNGGDADPRLQRMEDDLAFVKRRLAEADADGAGPVDTPAPAVSDDEVRARADSPQDADDTDADPSADRDVPAWIADAPDEQPARNQPRGPKADWLAAEVDRKVRGDRTGSGTIAPEAIPSLIRDAYDFDDDVVDDLSDMVLDRIPHEPAPTENMICWGPLADELWDEHEAEQQDDEGGEDDEDDVWSAMEDAERGRR